ncbi:head maturation protease, ClpP-related [Alkalihalobacillus sp. FSL R5-0424]
MTKHKINVKGAIIESDLQWIYDLFDIEATSPKKVADEIETAAGKDIEVIINSGGGSVYAASEIYTDLRSYQGIVETKIVGVAASAASVIAMAGKLSMSPTAQMMIHNASTYAGGDYRDMDDASDFLKNVNKTIANAYQAKSGLSESELLKLMDETTWFTAQQAKEKNLIDEIMFEETTIKLSASADVTNLLPLEVITAVRNGKLAKEPKLTEVSNDYVTKDDLNKVLEQLKKDIQPKDSNPVPASKPKQNMMKSFLNF